MSNKKIRGLKRKTKNMIKRIEQETEVFPVEFYNGYWHLHLPVSQSFISSFFILTELNQIDGLGEKIGQFIQEDIDQFESVIPITC